jgi:enolase-phosphatase E1
MVSFYFSVYDDVPKALDDWTKAGHKIYIYSSGSVDAQKLLFANSVSGDLLKFISGHFDTKIGAKQDADSYISIVKELSTTADDVVFLTDVVNGECEISSICCA